MERNRVYSIKNTLEYFIPSLIQNKYLLVTTQNTKYIQIGLGHVTPRLWPDSINNGHSMLGGSFSTICPLCRWHLGLTCSYLILIFAFIIRVPNLDARFHTLLCYLSSHCVVSFYFVTYLSNQRIKLNLYSAARALHIISRL